MKNIFQIIILGLLPLSGFSQNILTPQQAADLTLANNYGIQIAKNNILTAENNADKKANGYLPTVNARGGVNADLGGSNQKFITGQEVSTANAFSWDGNVGVVADYTLYNKQRDATLEQLKENLNLTNLQLRQTIENNLLQVYNQYYEIARLEANLNVLKQVIENSRERLERAEIGLDYGQGSGLDVLNARVDIQRDSVNILNAQQAFLNAQRRLNVAMGRTTITPFSVDTTVVYSNSLSLEKLQAAALENNVSLLLNRQNLVINEMGLAVIEAGKKPVVTADASYNVNYSNPATGSFIESSNSRGFGVGVAARWNIFDGGSREIQKQNVQVSLLNQQLQQQQILQEIERDVINRWGDYQNALFVLEVEKSSVATNRENFERTKEQQKLGQVSSLAYRQAQLNLLNATTSLNTAKFAAKVIEMELLQLGGLLIGE